MKEVNFLDVTLNLSTGLYKTYIKPNDTPLYVHKKSNHPPSIIRNLPAAINKRISSLSANEDIFSKTKQTYQEALRQSEYDFQLKFDPPPPIPSTPLKKKNNRKREITWFNPPFDCQVKTNIGAKFLRLIDQNFPKDHPLHPLINRNTVKIGYRCLPNLKKVIAQHNSKI